MTAGLIKPFDTTMRGIYEAGLAAWLEFLGFAVPDPDLPRVIDSNLASIVAEADKLVRLDRPEPLVVHTEFLSEPGRGLSRESPLV